MSDQSLLTSEDQSRLEGELSEMFSELVALDPMTVRSDGGTRVIVGELDYRRSRSDSNTSRHIHETVVIFEADDLDLPQFVMAPRQTGLIGKLFSSLGTVAEIDFSDTSEFHQTYRVMGWVEEAVSVLFTPALRQQAADQPGWTVRGRRRLLLVYQHNHLVSGDQLDEFVADALRLASAFREGEAELDARSDVHREATVNDLIAAGERSTGFAGDFIQQRLIAQLRKLSITPQERDCFLDSPPPRAIPPGMKRQVLGDNLMLVVLGLVFLIAGLIVGGLTVAFANPNDRWIGALFLIAFPLIGGLMAGLTLRHRLRKSRVLREGALAEGLVEKVRHSSVVVNNQVRHVATIRYDSNGRTRTTTCNLYGPAADAARRAADSSTPVRLLVDPKDSSHVVCIDTLLTMEPGQAPGG